MPKPKKNWGKALLSDRKRRGLGVGDQATLPGTRAVGRTVRGARKAHDLHVDAFSRIGKGIFKAFKGVGESAKKKGY